MHSVLTELLLVDSGDVSEGPGGPVQRQHQRAGLGPCQQQHGAPLAAEAGGRAERALLQGAVQPAGQRSSAAAEPHPAHGRRQPDNGNRKFSVIVKPL